jgi:hypothetical protein
MQSVWHGPRVISAEENREMQFHRSVIHRPAAAAETAGPRRIRWFKPCLSVKSPLFFSAAILALVTAGCDRNPVEPAYENKVTVFGYLWGNERLTADHAVFLARTLPVGAVYDEAAAAIRNAAVTVTETASGRIFVLSEAAGRPGYYFNDSLFVTPAAEYRLSAAVGGETVTGVTRVPVPLTVTTELRADTVNVVRPERLAERVPLTLGCDDPEQLVMVDMNCRETWQNAEYITVFHGGHKNPGNAEEYDGGRNAEPKHIQAVARFREFYNPDFPGRTVITWYSSMIVFYGTYTMQVSTIDANLHHYLFAEHPELSGGIEGGIGVFGSLTGTRFTLEVVK